MMQMVADRDVANDFFTQILGFDTFYKGKPYTAKTPTPTPIGIPLSLTTSIPYRAGIVYPLRGVWTYGNDRSDGNRWVRLR